MHCCAQRELDEDDMARLSVLVFLHDIGKANAGFQSRFWQLPKRPPPDWPTSPYGHSASRIADFVVRIAIYLYQFTGTLCLVERLRRQ
jgi:hypothetical protein